jgi:hypothetical protein
MIRKPTVLSQVKLYSGLEGAILEGGEIGTRIKISLIDFRNIYQVIRDTKEFNKKLLINQDYNELIISISL